MEEGPGREEGREGPRPKGRLTWEITGRATPRGKGKERLRFWEGAHALQTTPGLGGGEGLPWAGEDHQEQAEGPQRKRKHSRCAQGSSSCCRQGSS